MSPVKTKALKKTKKAIEEPEETTEETENEEIGGSEDFPVKSKKGVVVALDEHVEIEIPDEKPEEDVSLKPEEDELAGEELVLDDEDLNPFGDKWEE